MNDTIRTMLHYIAENDMAKTRAVAKVLLQSNKTQKDQEFCEKLLKRMDAQEAKGVEIPYNMKSIIRTESTPYGFEIDRYYLTGREKTILLKLKQMYAVGEKMGKKIEVKDMEFDSLVASIGNKIDMAIAGMTVTEERQKTVDFSQSYYNAVQTVIVPVDSTKIGVQLGTTGDFTAEEIAGEGKGAEEFQYNKAVDAVNDLLNGRLDCVIVDTNPAEVFVSQYSDQLKAIDGSEFGFEPEEYAIALPKGDKELLDAVNKAIDELKADGTYDALVKEYIEQ